MKLTFNKKSMDTKVTKKIIQIMPISRKMNAVFLIGGKIYRTAIDFLALVDTTYEYPSGEIDNEQSVKLGATDNPNAEPIVDGVDNWENFKGIEYDGIEQEWN